jgi:hypothetical protein
MDGLGAVHKTKSKAERDGPIGAGGSAGPPYTIYGANPVYDLWAKI